MDEVDNLDELALLDEQELEEDGDLVDSGSGSDADSEEEDGEEHVEEALSEEQYERLKFTVVDIVTAMGGLEETIGQDGQMGLAYVIGDDCLRCLRDLRKLWREDEENPNRVIPRIYAEVNVLQTGLLPLLLKTTDMGEKGRKMALACTDLLATITWPIDFTAEKRAAQQKEEVDGEAIATLCLLERAMISYKLAVLRTKSRETNGSKRSVLSSIMLLVLLPCLSKARHERTERDLGVISMCLHLFRNLLAINDPLSTSLSSLEEMAMSRLQSDLIIEMDTSRILDTILMLCSNADSKDYNSWNVVSSECVYYIFAGSRPDELTERKKAQAKTQAGNAMLPATVTAPAPVKVQSELGRLLAAEAREAVEAQQRSGSTRHSRFNTMINFIDKDGNRRMASGQAALRKSVEQLTTEADDKGKRRISRRRALEEKGSTLRRSAWTPSALRVVSAWADQFLRLAFESLMRSVLEDIRRERIKVGDLDQARTRVMQIGSFFLEYFMHRRQTEEQGRGRSALADLPNEKDGAAQAAEETLKDQSDKPGETETWSFSLIGQWLEPWALRMAYVRCSFSFEKKVWIEYVAAINLWTTLFKVIDLMSKSSAEEDREAAEGILATHFYDQAALDSAKSVLASYSSQSFYCLRAIISLAYAMPRLLERYSKDKDHMYVKAKKQVRSSRSAAHTSASLAEEEQEARAIAKGEQTERKFEFNKFQSKMCSQRLADACLTYLCRWREFQTNPEEQLHNVIQVLHRLAVKAGDVRLFYPYTRRMNLRKLQDDYSFWSFVQSHAPGIEADAKKLIEYVLRKFDKLDEAEKEKWGEGMGRPKPIKVFKMPAELEIEPSQGHMDDLGIAVGLMLERDKLKSLLWVKSGLEEAIRLKNAIVEEERELEDGDDEESSAQSGGIPTSALSRFTDFQLSYGDDEELRHEASTGPEVKLLCRLLALKSDETEEQRWIWAAPAEAFPDELEKEVELLEDFLRRPLDTFGEKFETMVQKVRKKKQAVASVRTVINEHGDEEQVTIRKTKGRRKEKQPQWVDMDMIEDSDEELEIGARLIEEQRRRELGSQGDEGTGGVASVKLSSRRKQSSRSSTVASSSSGSSSPRLSSSLPSSTSSTPKRGNEKKVLSRTKALFRESDDEEDGDEEEGSHESRNETRQSEGGDGGDDDDDGDVTATEPPRPYTAPLAKRALILSDDDDDEDDERTRQSFVMQPRKRRALIDEDDDDE